jgi:phosphomannomutase
MIIASYNPYIDNGIKIFDKIGQVCVKFEEKLEIYMDSLEIDMGSIRPVILVISSKISEMFLNFILSIINVDNKLHIIIIDTADGLLTNFTKEIYSDVDQEVVMIGDDLNKKLTMDLVVRI